MTTIEPIRNADHLILDHCRDVVATDCARIRLCGAIDVVIEAVRDVQMHRSNFIVSREDLARAVDALNELHYSEEVRELGEPERYVRTVLKALFDAEMFVKS